MQFMSIPASISLARRSDARELVALRSAVAQEMTRQFGEGHWSQSPSHAEVVRQLRASHVLVARSESQIVGTVRLVRTMPWAIDSSSFTPVSESLYVLGLAVSPAWRDRGIGRQLMDAAKHTARSRGAQALWLDAYQHRAGAGSFYLKCGFRKVGATRYRESALFYFEWLAAQESAGSSPSSRTLQG
jgi:GNAT superfamily N-acetyltransferase